MSTPETTPGTGTSPSELRPGQEPPGGDLGRIISLTDGVFAFALTLLVLSLAVPVLNGSLPAAQLSGQLWAALRSDYGAFLGYVFVFVMIAIWWIIHHRLFRYILRYDDLLVTMNLGLLLEIAVMPFVLKVYVSYSDTTVAVILFALIEVATGLTLALIWWYATHGHRLVAKNLPESVIRYFRYRTLFSPVVFTISIAVAFVSVTAAEICWLGVFVSARLSLYSQKRPGDPDSRSPPP